MKLHPLRLSSLSIPFCKQDWKDLTIATYAIPQAQEAMLQRLLPQGVELDRWNGQALVSIVALDMKNTRVMGHLPLPGGSTPAVNFRLYVKCGDEHGVVFIRNVTNNPSAVFAGNEFLRAPYTRTPVDEWVSPSSNGSIIERRYTLNGHQNTIRAEVSGVAQPIQPGSLEDFLTQRVWGFADRNGKTIEYSASHPEWNIFPDSEFKLDIDFRSYGSEWDFLNDQKPVSVVQADGSTATLGLPKRVSLPPDAYEDQG